MVSVAAAEGCLDSMLSPASCPTLTQHTLAEASQLHVGILKGVLHFLVERDLLALHQDGGASVQDALWGSLHHQHMALGAVLSLMDGQLQKGQEIIERPSTSQ